MATPLSADRILQALRAEGVDVSEYKSWRTHNRNHVGAWGPVHGVMIHHTVSSGTMNSVELCYNGHSALPGPLCHTVGAKDGRLYMVGSGRANHAGSGDGDVLRAVIDEKPLPADNEANTDGNRHFYGIELINLGDGKDPWPETQKEAAVRWAAAICRAHQWSERSVIAHKEWQPGKIDPTFDMAAFRARVAERLVHPASWSPGSTPAPPLEEPVTPAEIEAVAKRAAELTFTKLLKTDDVIAAPVDAADYATNKFWTLQTHVQDITSRVRQTQKAVAAVAAKVDALAPELTPAQLQAIAAQVSTSPTLAESIAELVADKLAARLAD
jgi:hypothetical protein